ncbi:MAG TPA: efflux RND transporter periplasmic adaptor subunit [Gammaproteobacteria bacterium]|nr:efflux RND transporter periplasmic adaptor subunit [Gammaproteobacteria bacterium]
MKINKIVFALLLLMLPPMLHAEPLRARLEWAHVVELRAFENGIVEKVNVLEGQHVKQEELLLTLDPRDYEIAVRAAAAQVKEAKAKHDKAQREHGWESELYDRGLISGNELQDAKVKLLQAESDVESAQAELAKAQLGLERSVLKAPFDGVIVAVRAWQGQVVLKTLQKEALIGLAQGRKMVARARVSADRVDEYSSGQAARVNIENQWRDGVVYRIGAVSEGVLESGIAYAVDTLIEVKENEVMRPGQFCIVDIKRAN